MAKDLTTSLIDRQNILNLDIVIAFRAIVALVKIQMQLRLVKLVYLSCRFLTEIYQIKIIGHTIG